MGQISRMLAAAFVVALAMPSGQAEAAESWEAKVAPGECTLTGTLDGPVPVTLSIHTVTGSDSYRLALVGKDLPKQPTQDLFPATLIFGGVNQRIDHKARGAKLAGDLGWALLFNGLGPDAMAAFAKSSSIAVESKTGVGPFPLTYARAAERALRGCVRDQLIEWGADPAQFAAGGKLPVALVPRDDWVPNDQLLKIPVPSDAKVDASFKVGVAPDGTIDSCTQIGTGVDEKSAKIACDAVLTRRLFTPASDAQGKPVRGMAAFEIHLFAVRTYNKG